MRYRVDALIGTRLSIPGFAPWSRDGGTADVMYRNQLRVESFQPGQIVGNDAACSAACGQVCLLSGHLETFYGQFCSRMLENGSERGVPLWGMRSLRSNVSPGSRK